MGYIKKIEFVSLFDFLSLPTSARTHIPEWYKKTDKYIGGTVKINKIGKIGSKTFKACMPFFDSLTTGYIVELWQDLEVTQTPSGPQLNWATNPAVVEIREKDSHGSVPVPAGHAAQPFVWKFPYAYKTEKGYSCLVTHPFNRFDLPFTTLSAVVDSDEGVSAGNIPFYIKENFEGIIPMGTPIMQIFPFKRNNWKLSENQKLKEMNKMYEFFSLRVSKGWYRNNIWKEKIYK